MRITESQNILYEAKPVIEQVITLCSVLRGADLIALRGGLRANSDTARAIGALKKIDLDSVEMALDTAYELLESLSGIKQYLTEKDENILSLKSSLTEALAENRALNKTNASINSEVMLLRAKLKQAEICEADNSVKLNTANSTIKKHAEELTSLRQELQNNMARVFQLKSKCAEHASDVFNQNKAYDELMSVNNGLVKQNLQNKKDLTHLENSNKILQASTEHLQKREKDLVKTIDALLKEKNACQKRLNNLLSGFKKSVEYELEADKELETSVLEPRTLKPFLPFCFPERLPKPVKFKREIQKSFRGQLKALNSGRPKMFLTAETLFLPSQETIKNALGACKRLLQPVQKYNIAKPQMLVNNPIDYALSLNMLSRAFNMAHSPLPHPKLNAVKPCCKTKARLAAAKSARAFKIKTVSIELIIKRLTAEVISKTFKSTTEGEAFKPKLEPIRAEYNRAETANYFYEKLAFRYGLQLQSNIIKQPAAKLEFSFKQGNRLKSVLKMFESTINSIFKKYDITNSGLTSGLTE